MRPPSASGRRPRPQLWWRWPRRAMVGGSGSKRRARRTRRRPNPAALLTDDLLVEILARAPYRSLCRFRCVCKHWRALIAHPDHRTRLPRTLAGFLYPMHLIIDDNDTGFPPWTTLYGFANVSWTGPPFIDASFSFLPDRKKESLVLVDCCNGLLLCRRYRFSDDHELDYLVLNPATEKWVTVPLMQRWPGQEVRLGFDPAVSPHFYVFEFLEDDVDEEDDGCDGDGDVLSVKIYSSATRVWIHHRTNENIELLIEMHFKSVFLNGVLYVNGTNWAIGAVDVEGKARTIYFPSSKDPPLHDSALFIDQSQGQLHLAMTDGKAEDKIAIYVLEDKDSEEWTLKHIVSFKHLIGRKKIPSFNQFIVAAIHPDRNLVFFVFDVERTLMSYDMDSGEVCTIRDLGARGEDQPFLSYVPLFSKTLPDGGN